MLAVLWWGLRPSIVRHLGMAQQMSTPCGGWLSTKLACGVVLEPEECLFLEPGDGLIVLVSLPSVGGMDQYKPCRMREVVGAFCCPGVYVTHHPSFAPRSCERHPFASSVSPGILGMAVAATTIPPLIRFTGMSWIPKSSSVWRDPFNEAVRDRHNFTFSPTHD